MNFRYLNGLKVPFTVTSFALYAIWIRRVVSRLSVNLTTRRVNSKIVSLISMAPFFVQATSYRSVSDGNWSASSTWQGGSIPSTTLSSGDSLFIRHHVTYTGSNNMEFRGVVIIQPLVSTIAKLRINTGINIEIASSGKLFIIDGSLRQYRFTVGNEGQPYSGNSPGASLNSGNFYNKGGYINILNSYVEVAQNWSSESGGVRIMYNSCLYTGQNYTLSGSTSMDSLNSVSISVGWHGSGNFEVSDATIRFHDVNVQVAGTGGHFKLNSGRAYGDIDYIYLRNQIAPFTGGGNIEVSSSVNNSPSLTLSAYCASSSSNLIHNSKFTGTRSLNCSLSVFPGTCHDSGLTLLSADLIAFNARETSPGFVTVKWMTASEHTNNYFELERSYEGGLWQSIAKIPGAGSSHIISHYAFEDKVALSGHYAYRLRMLDFSGKSEYSEGILIEVKKSNKPGLVLFPNPVDKLLNVDLPADNISLREVSVVVTDAMGKEVEVLYILNGAGLILKLDAFSPGLYHLNITMGDEVLHSVFKVNR